MSKLILSPVPATSITNPPLGYLSTFFDSTDGNKLKYRDSLGNLVTIGSGGSGSSLYVVTANIFTRNSIPPNDRSDGMMIHVLDTTGVGAHKFPKTYQLKGGISDAYWNEIGVSYKDTYIITTNGQTIVPLINVPPIDVIHTAYISGLLLRETTDYNIIGNDLIWIMSGVNLEAGESITIVFNT